MQTKTTFQVYNASAGSGKTFTLVKEYLKILLQAEDVFLFQKILAITFTNKAAGEMKERVLSCLDDFSKGIENDYYGLVLNETTLDKDTIKNRSAKVLEAILQNYSAFSITTIDSFTHKIIKSFAFDLGLTLNFEVEMDAVSLLSEAVDMLISKIGTDKELTKLLIEFSLSKTDDDKSWDISRELNEFSKILLNENDTKYFRKLANKSLKDFYELKEKLIKSSLLIEESFKNIGITALELIKKQHLTFSDFAYAGECPKHFQKLLNLRILKPDDLKFSGRIDKNFSEDKNLYASKTDAQTKEIINSIYEELKDLYLQSKTLFEQNIGIYTFNQLALKSVIPLAVLNHINSELTMIKEDNNIRLNAEFNQLISDNIKDQPTPFIYERIGQRFMYYFIDEMQDTSVLQWQNLIPLINNALAQENSNLLLVGDGKQAIYRWRGGKASQFINLSSEGNNSENPFLVEKQLKNLEKNFRSYSEVINFNNHFFQHTANFLQKESYKKLFIDGNKQHENAKKGGYVSISFLDKEEEKEEEKIKYPKKVLEKINQLKTAFSLNEICVLVRKKKDGVAVANYLSENGIKIISSETLLLQNSSKVQFLVAVLQVIQHPNDEETRFSFLYFLHKHLQVSEDKHTFLQKFVKQPNEVIFQQLKDYGINFDLITYHQLPFYEKVETIIRDFNLILSSDAYIQFFLDVALEQQRKDTDVQGFLDFWEVKKEKLSIVAPKNSDAVQIMTIHKSKGLEFPVVIFPCDLNIYQQINPKIWLDELPDNYNGFQELLIDFSSKITHINNRSLEIYDEVRQELELDNFNLLYVALTRPIEQLHIITEYRVSFKGENLNYYSGVFINYLKALKKWDDTVLEYSFGSSNRVSETVLEKSSIEIQEQFISTSWRQHNIKMLANSSKLWDTKQGEAIDFGNLIHEILSKIYTPNDVETVINQYEKQGEFSHKEKEKIKTYIYDVVQHPKLQFCFSENATVYNERELVSEDNTILIPDKLIIINNTVTIVDYKTGAPNKKYREQLKRYENVLKTMRFSVDKKLLIYIGDTILIEEVA